MRLTFCASTFLEPVAEEVVFELPEELEEDAASSAEELVVLDSDLFKSLEISVHVQCDKRISQNEVLVFYQLFV